MAKNAFPAFALVTAAALLMLFGCTLTDQAGNAISPTDRFSATSLVVPKYLENRNDLLCKELDDPKPCYCFTCKKTQENIIPLLLSSYDNTLVGGTCGASTCSQEDYIGYVSTPGDDVEMRSFMLGSGQSFVSSGWAGLYCNYTLQLGTKWMRGGENRPPAVPLAERAYCWLGRDMLPLFIYYTGGKGIDPARTLEIAQALNSGDSGPAILTTEAGWDGADTAAAGKVKEQLEKMQACTKCVKVLAVKSNDYSALYSIFGMPGGNMDRNMLDKVDAVGFGFRANDYPHCDMDTIIYENIKFSHYILQKYGKPTIWLYVGASEGNSSLGDERTGGCTWKAEDVSRFYKEMMSRTGDMASAGVLGMSLYEWVDRSGPIACNGLQGCDFGMLNVKGEQKHPELNTWSDMCQEINARSPERKPLIFSRNGQGGTLCDSPDLQNAQPFIHSGAEIQGDTLLATGNVNPIARIKDMGCGEACPGAIAMPSIYYSGASAGFSDRSHCTEFPLIDEYADDFDISATYMRGTFEGESGFDPYAISLECKDEDFAGCNPKAYTSAQICKLAGMENDPLCKKDVCTGTNPNNGKKLKPCAFGLAQCIDYPGSAYSAATNPFLAPSEAPPVMRDYIKNCGADKYNPFDPGMSACCGANVFGAALREDADATEKWVKHYWSQLAPANCPGGMVEGEQGWAAYYLASNRYFGASWNRLTDFVNQRPCTGGSGTYNHYIEYLRSLNQDNSYGAQAMSRYRAAAAPGMCDSECPR